MPESVIASLPRVLVRRVQPLGVSAFTHWEHGRWQIALNGLESLVRQRYTLAHEAKHLIDHQIARVAYRRTTETELAWIERVCDYFAACLLMPKPWVKKLYCNEGVQDQVTLARRFAVSQAAMRVRLAQLGLTDPTPRCLYRRSAPLVLNSLPAHHHQEVAA